MNIFICEKFIGYTLKNSALLTIYFVTLFQASQLTQLVKNPPANSGDIERWVRSLDGEDPLD